MSSLENRVAIVTGAGRGIGRSIALKLAANGAAVVVNDLDREPAEETVARITESGGKAVAFAADATGKGFAEAFVNKAVDTFGGLDIIINNAGYTWDSAIQKMSDDQWDAIINLHLKTPFQILRAAQPVFKANPVDYHRKVVNVSSNAGLFGNKGQSNYSSAKAGVVGLTKTLAREWGRYKVNVNAVSFGLIATRLTGALTDSGSVGVNGREIKVGVSEDVLAAAARMIPLGRPGTPDEAAGAVYMLCTRDADYVNGQCIVCDGGAR